MVHLLIVVSVLRYWVWVISSVMLVLRYSALVLEFGTRGFCRFKRLLVFMRLFRLTRIRVNAVIAHVEVAED